MVSEIIFLTFAKLVVLILGIIIVVVSYGAYRRVKSRMMLFVSLGFGLITLGSLVEGFLFEILKNKLAF
ncbi:MAG: hypothetical protein NXY59_01970 [Aigarchaeota archaeon]|nr:hypothetical protein [Candidatus Pelearchaeum maunauluense]